MERNRLCWGLLRAQQRVLGFQFVNSTLYKLISHFRHNSSDKGECCSSTDTKTNSGVLAAGQRVILGFPNMYYYILYQILIKNKKQA